MQIVYPPVLEELQKTDDIQITAICNRTLGKATDLAKKLSLNDIYTCADADDLFSKRICDIVIIATKGKIKTQMCLEALETGHHVFLETPAGNASAPVKKISSLAREKNLFVQVAEDFAFFPKMRGVREIQTKEKLGEILKIENQYSVFSYHAFALLGSFSQRARKKKVKKYQISSDERFYYRNLSFKDFSYHEKYPHDRSDPIKKEGEVIFHFENKVISSKDVETPAAVFTDKRQDALYFLLKNLADVVEGSGEELSYPVSQAAGDITLWRSSQLQLAIPALRNFHSPSVLHLAEKVFGLLRR